VVTTLKGRRELRGVPIYVLMPDDEFDTQMGRTEDVHLLAESDAEAELPGLLHRTTREQSGVRRGVRSTPPPRPPQRLAGGPLRITPDRVPPKYGSGQR
jgi:hypothetical protein